MHIFLDPRLPDPLYEQIAAFFRRAIAAGQLVPETRLPASRVLARDLGVSRLTVQTAYTRLETEGLVYTRVGSGVYTLPAAPPALPAHPPQAPWPLWQQELAARRASAHTPLPILDCRDDPIDLSTGVGAAELYPRDELRKAIHGVLRDAPAAALEYGDPQGYAPLRELIARILASQGLQTQAGGILVTTGSQQALALTAQAVLRPGDSVVVENPTYSGALGLFQMMGYRILRAPFDSEGLRVDRLEELIQKQRPSLIYTMPTFHNPTGVCLSLPRRRALLALAEQYNLPVLEDDYVGDLRFEGRALPPLKALDSAGNVIYISTFSKMVTPGLRVGFLAADGPVLQELIRLKRLTDLSTSGLAQRAVAAYISVGSYQSHLSRSRQIYRKRRDAAIKAVRQHLGHRARCVVPRGGLFLWLELTGGASCARLLPAALAAGVSFAPGGDFFADPAEGQRCLRLNFSVYPPEVFEEGARRLGQALRQIEQEAPLSGGKGG